MASAGAAGRIVVNLQMIWMRGTRWVRGVLWPARASAQQESHPHRHAPPCSSSLPACKSSRYRQHGEGFRKIVAERGPDGVIRLALKLAQSSQRNMTRLIDSPKEGYIQSSRDVSILTLPGRQPSTRTASRRVDRSGRLLGHQQEQAGSLACPELSPPGKPDVPGGRVAGTRVWTGGAGGQTDGAG